MEGRGRSGWHVPFVRRHHPVIPCAFCRRSQRHASHVLACILTFFPFPTLPPFSLDPAPIPSSALIKRLEKKRANELDQTNKTSRSLPGSNKGEMHDERWANLARKMLAGACSLDACAPSLLPHSQTTHAVCVRVLATIPRCISFMPNELSQSLSLEPTH